MSNGKRSVSRDLRLFLEDIESACRRIIRYTDGSTRDEVFSDEMRFDAVLHLPNSFRDRHPTIEWREIAGIRDVVAHAYFALDLDILWDAVRTDVPALLDRVPELIVSLDE